jgi:hypothetical protein
VDTLVGALVGDEVGDEVGVVGEVVAEDVGALEVGGLDVGAEVVGPVLGEADGLAVGDELARCTTGDGWCPRAGVTGLGDTTRSPAGARRMAANATAPPTAASPATVTVAGWVPNRRNSVRRRSASSAGRLARWAPRLLSGADTNARVGQTSRTAVT